MLENVMIKRHTMLSRAMFSLSLVGTREISYYT